jgi:hypothetical protein
MNPKLRPYRVAIVGSRDYPDLERVGQYVDELHRGCTVISGGARGVDSAAEQAARRLGLRVEIFPAAWARLGRRAGYVRNRRIVEACDLVVAFWDCRSPGTRHTLEIAAQLGRPTEIVYACSTRAPAQELRR